MGDGEDSDAGFMLVVADDGDDDGDDGGGVEHGGRIVAEQVARLEREHAGEAGARIGWIVKVWPASSRRSMESGQ